MKTVCYDLVVLLSPSVRKPDGSFDELNDTPAGASYLGGQTRMDAAADFASFVRTYLLVGGSEKKVHDMADFLEETLKQRDLHPRPRLIRIVSEANTLGNLWAVRNYLIEAKGTGFLRTMRIGLMTNAYHLPRAMRFAAYVFEDTDITFIPLASEEIRKHDTPMPVEYTEALTLRLQNESNGLRAWETGTYTGQERPGNSWDSTCLDTEELHRLGDT